MAAPIPGYRSGWLGFRIPTVGSAPRVEPSTAEVDTLRQSRDTVATRDSAEVPVRNKFYTIPTCPHCRTAREYLVKKGVDFIEFDVSTNLTRSGRC